jgi:SRSO17 transposase
MSYGTDFSTSHRAREFFHVIVGEHLRRPEQRESFATYAFGILGDGERKSVEPIAARAFSDPEDVQRCHDRLLYFIRDSPWSDRDVRRAAARYAVDAMREHDPVTVWIVDDTGFLKQGKNSVGVKRQYTGSAGKVTNCQIGVSLCASNRKEQVPIDFELYLPHDWTDDPRRMKAARIPEDRAFKTKPELALDMIGRAKADGIPGDIVLADAGYGDSSSFRAGLRGYGLDYAVAIKSPTRLWLLGMNNELERVVSAADLGAELGPTAFRRITWRTGTKGKLSSRFCFRRVKPAHGDGEPDEKEPLWLVMEWPDGEAEPTKFALTTLPRRMTKKQIIRIIKERWRTEILYEELKGELGLDHFEGRSFPGWNHHVSVVLCCYAFVVVERMRHFPPSARRQA